MYLDPVSFPVLSQIKPQVPLFVCPSVNSFKFQPCDHTPPRTHRLWFPKSPGGVEMDIALSLASIIYS